MKLNYTLLLLCVVLLFGDIRISSRKERVKYYELPVTEGRYRIYLESADTDSLEVTIQCRCRDSVATKQAFYH